MIFKCIDHVAFAVTDLDRTIAWWSRLLDSEPFDRGTWRAADIGDYVGTKVGYTNCDMSAAVWALPGGTVLELIEYHNPPPGRVDMATYNAGNAHFCFETIDIRADYERMRGHRSFAALIRWRAFGARTRAACSGTCGTRTASRSNLCSSPSAAASTRTTALSDILTP